MKRLVVVVLLAVVSCKKEAPATADASVAAAADPKPKTVPLYVGSPTVFLLDRSDGGYAPGGKLPLELLAALDVALPADGGTHAHVYAGGKPVGWVQVSELLETKPTAAESMKAAVTALASGEWEAA